MNGRALVFVSGLAGLGLMGASHGYACGDKFLVVGRGVKYGRSHAAAHPASIVMYGNVASKVIAKDKLEASLKRAGHKVRPVADVGELEGALKSARYDLVLADLADSSGLENQVGSQASRPVVVPVLYDPTAAELAAAKEKYGCALKAPSKDYLARIDEIMATRLKASSGKSAKSK